VCRFGAVVLESPQQPRAVGSDLSSACQSCDYCSRSCTAKATSEIKAMIQASHGVARLQFSIDPVACEGCGVCAHFCPESAIELVPAVNGEWLISETRHGPMVHARLGVAEENSGKLVSRVREEARRIAEERQSSLVLIDGSPGIGCPVIASITGADLVLVVTEPTLSGLHDLQRVLDLADHFSVPALVCINKWDLNPDLSGEIESRARERNVQVVGKIRYDCAVTRAQIRGQTVIEHGGDAAEDVRSLWKRLTKTVDQHGNRLIC
jgi:MinD superfamily P-loop ATPase